MAKDVCNLAPLPDATEVVNPDRRLSHYWRGWIFALLTALNELKCGVLSGTGSPETVVIAPVGTLYRQTDGTPSLWVKETGTGNTGWVSK